VGMQTFSQAFNEDARLITAMAVILLAVYGFYLMIKIDRYK